MVWFLMCKNRAKTLPWFVLVLITILNLIMRLCNNHANLNDIDYHSQNESWATLILIIILNLIPYWYWLSFSKWMQAVLILRIIIKMRLLSLKPRYARYYHRFATTIIDNENHSQLKHGMTLALLHDVCHSFFFLRTSVIFIFVRGRYRKVGIRYASS